MSKDKKAPVADKVIDVNPDTADKVVQVVPPPAPPSRLMETDKLALDLARAKRQTALETAKTALAQNENAELAYKYLVLQIYMKYGLTEQDAISEAGDIVRGGAVQQRPQGQ